MNPRPDHGEESYRGSGRLAGKAAVITGADSGVGRAVAIAFAREGAAVLISYLDEHDDARETARWVEKAGSKAVLMPGRPGQRGALPLRHRRRRHRVRAGRRPGQQRRAAADPRQAQGHHRRGVGPDPRRQPQRVLLPDQGRAAARAMPPGASIIGTSSVNADSPTPTLLPYDVTKAGIANMTAALAQLLAPRLSAPTAWLPAESGRPLHPLHHAVRSRGELRLLRGT